MSKHKMNKLGIRVKNKLNRINMKQKELAELIGISPQMLSAVLRGSNTSLMLEEWLDDWCNDKPFREYDKVNKNRSE